jgi:hypothetical protein
MTTRPRGITTSARRRGLAALATTLVAVLLSASTAHAQTPPPPPPPPSPPPVGAVVSTGLVLTATPTCALSDGTTTVTVTARDAPTGALTCRFIDYAIALTFYEAATLVATTSAAYVAADAAAAQQEASIGFVPDEAAATNQARPRSSSHRSPYDAVRDVNAVP